MNGAIIEPEQKAPKRRLLVVSTSELSVFRTCRMKHFLRYQVGWTPGSATEAQTRGTVGHRGLEEIYRAVQAGMRERNNLLVVGARSVGEWIDTSTKEGRTLAPDLYDHMTGALARYVDKFAIDDHVTRGYRVHAVEMPVAVKLRNSKGSANAHVIHVSKIDLVLEDERELIIVEHKFTDDDCSTFEARFDVDPQTPGYVYALRELYPDKRVGRVILNVVRRHGPKHPGNNQITKRDCSTLDVNTNKWVLDRAKWDRLSTLEAESTSAGKEGNQGIVSAAAIDTTKAIYYDALEDQRARGLAITDKQMALAESLPANEDRWMCRHEHYFTEGEVQRWQDDAHADGQLIRMVKRGVLRPSRNGASCFPKNAFPCEVREMCVNETLEPLDPTGWQKLDQSVEARLQRLHKDS